MKRNVFMFFFCAVLVGLFSAATASAGIAPSADQTPLKESLPYVGVSTLELSPVSSCVPTTDEPTRIDDADDEDAARAEYGAEGALFCAGEDGGPGEAAYLYYDEAGRPAFDVCLQEEAEVAATYGFLSGIAISAPGIAEDNICLNGEFDVTPEDSLPTIPIVVNKNVESFIKYFQGSGRKSFEKWWDRSQHWMVMIREILRENGLPEDLSYIAFIESGLNPRARSRANAVGMWQFIKGTAVRYGLRVDWWIDERMDPEKATYAAARYFTDLYGRFGSWYLAAAGYNAGEGRVMQAVRKHGSEDFWELASYKKPFKRETKNYVPKYLAALMIAKDPVSYGFDEIEYREDPAYEKVKLSQATDLRVIARAADTTVKEIQRLNPELIRWFTPPNYPDYEIKIPVGSTERFVENLKKIPSAKKIAFLRHKIRRGDTLSHIARRYKTSVKPIMYLNNIESARRLKPGMVLVIPVRAERVGKRSENVADVLARWDLPG